MGAQRAPRGPLALDAGALIALETARGRALLRRVAADGAPVIISAGALGQAWRAPGRQALLSALVKRDETMVVALDAAAAKACGLLLARSGTADVVDAHVVLSARERGATAIVTGDATDLARLDPAASLHEI